MNKTIAALTLSAALAISGAALAQQADGAKAGNAGSGKHHHRMNADDRAAMTDARIAALQAGLKLNAEQQKLWPDVEKALRDAAKVNAERMAKAREARKEAREEGERIGYIERLRMGADMASERAAEMRKLADAVEPLYKTLDEGQQRRMRALMLMADSSGPQHHHHGKGKHKH